MNSTTELDQIDFNIGQSGCERCCRGRTTVFRVPTPIHLIDFLLTPPGNFVCLMQPRLMPLPYSCNLYNS